MQEGALDVVRAERGARYEWRGLALSSLFQPIHCVERGSVVGDEALVRIANARGEPVRARDLRTSLESADRARFEWTCRALHLRSHASSDSGDRRLFLNVDPAALADDGEASAAFAQLVRFYGLTPERVVLEILAYDSGDETRLARAVAQHRDSGFAVAMDHFGRGHSNFERLAALRPRIVKVDRSALADAIGDTQAGRRLPALIGMLNEAGAEVAVKGVENARESLVAIEAGAAYLQGAHLGVPSRSPRRETLSRELIQSARRLANA
jgi:EAL domain-containing protein (putative c-di-GMP-specific phosphodiesterase class I)